jgi:cytochrome c peroxidase
MKQTQMGVIAGVSVTATLAMVITTHIVYGQVAPASLVYNSYPTGILPSNLDSEVARVLRVVDFRRNCSNWAVACYRAPTLTGNPPILQNAGVASIKIHAKLMNLNNLVLQ